MGRCKSTRVDQGHGNAVIRCNFTLDADLDLKFTTWARKHKLTRSQAANQAIALLVRGTRIGFSNAASGEADPIE